MLCHWGEHNVLGGGAQTEKIQKFFLLTKPFDNVSSPQIVDLQIWYVHDVFHAKQVQ